MNPDEIPIVLEHRDDLWVVQAGADPRNSRTPPPGRIGFGRALELEQELAYLRAWFDACLRAIPPSRFLDPICEVVGIVLSIPCLNTIRLRTMRAVRTGRHHRKSDMSSKTTLVLSTSSARRNSSNQESRQ